MTDTPHSDASAWRLLCLGLGFTAEALARKLGPSGTHIAGTARTDEGVQRLRSMGWDAHVFDAGGRGDGLAAAIDSATHVLVSAAPEKGGDPVLTHLGDSLASSRTLRWVGYLSTVGVYGDHGGGWVDETTAPRNPGRGDQSRLDAEQAWLDFGAAHGIRVDIFRLPGIYGPGRGAVDQLLAGVARRISKPGQVFNRAHVDDIAAAVAAAMARPSAYQIYNITDDEPAPNDEVVAFAAHILGLEAPPLVPLAEARLPPMALQFYEQSKRVSNRRMKENLGVNLLYPSYREGMTAIAEHYGRRKR